jgi:predicted dehydrogenase
MDAGCNVILEKPMTSTLEDAEKIVEHQKKTGLKVGVIHNWLFEPPVVEAKHIVGKGQLGEIFHVEVEALHTVNDQMTADPNHWSHEHPGGRFGEMIAHPLYLLRHFLGEVQITNLQVSKIGELEWMKSDELIMSVMSDKKFGSAYVSFNSPRKAIYINIYGKEALLTLDVINAISTILPAKPANRFGKGIDSLRQATQLITDTGKNVSKIAFNKWWSGHEMFLKLFAESILNKTEPPVTVHDGYVVMKALDEACKLIEKEQEKDNST